MCVTRVAATSYKTEVASTRIQKTTEDLPTIHGEFIQSDMHEQVMDSHFLSHMKQGEFQGGHNRLTQDMIPLTFKSGVAFV